MLENNIQQALSQGLIDLDDAIDLRDVRNVKLANQLLKLKRKKKADRDQAMQQENIQAQSEANAQAQEAAAQAEIQKRQAEAQIQSQLEKEKNDLKVNYLRQEAVVKKELMDHEFQINMQLKNADNASLEKRDAVKEETKRGESLKNFESSGNDVVGGGIGLGSFDPR